MAGLIRKDDIEAVRNAARIEDVVGDHVTLKPAGIGSLKGLCPFHDERTPSFNVRPAVGMFHCFGCGESGDVISFVQKIDHLPFAEAVEALAAKTGITQAMCAHFGVGYAPRSWDALIRHLRSRGYTDQEIQTAGLASQGARGIYDRFRGRLVWPIRDITGATVGFGARRLDDDEDSPKYLNTPETPIYKKSQLLYGLDLAKKAITQGHRVVIVEG